MGDRWDALADDLVRGAQESYVADLTRLTEDMLRRGVHNPDMFAVLARDARQAALGVWARWSGKVSRQAEEAFRAALQEQDEELLEGIERAGVPPLHPDDGNWSRNRIGEAARGMAEIMRRQNVAFADTQADLWYDVTAQAVTRTLGGEPRDSVMQRAVSRLAAKGLETVDYRSGVRTSIDAAVRRHVVTQSNQCRNDLLDRRCGQYGIDLVMVSAHYGARPSHAVWQGGVYSRSGARGKYRGLAEATGYGTVGGLCGANCRHTMTPYIEGVSKPQGTDFAAQQRVTGLTSDQYYEAVQQQRAAERRIRDTKRQIAALARGNLDTAALRVTLGKQQAELRKLVDDYHLTRDYSREKAYGLHEQPRGARPATRVVTDRRKAVAYAGARLYEGTRFADTLAGIVGKDKARDVLDGVYKRLSTCKVKGLAKLWGDTFHGVSVGLNDQKGAYYWPGRALAKFEAKYLGMSASDDYTTPLQTIFHEVGHAVDNRLGGGMHQARAMTADGELGRIIFSDWADVAAAKAKERTGPLRAKLAEVRSRGQWDVDTPGSELLNAMVAVGVATDADATRAKSAARLLRRWTDTLDDDEWEKATEQGIGRPDWVIATPDGEKRRVLPPDVYDMMKLERPPDAQRMLASAERGARASKVAVTMLRKEFERTLKKSEYGDVSDWVECLSGEDHPFGFGHGLKYWTRSSKLFGGGAKGAQRAREVALSCEAWAELCDSALANQSAYELLRRYFPNAVKWFEDKCEKEASR